MNCDLPAAHVYQSACTQCQACAKVTCNQLGACDEIVTLVIV